MSDHDPQEQSQPSRSERPRDELAAASELEKADIPLERERNSVRLEQEGLKDRKTRRWVFVLVIGALVVAVAALVLVIAVALAHHDYQRAALLVTLASGGGAAAVSAWSKF
jgi:hypothetical protein